MELLQKVCVFPRPALRDPAMREKRESIIKSIRNSPLTKGRRGGVR